MQPSQSILQHYSRPPARAGALGNVHRVNNYVKACLIVDHLPPNGHVLDMPCGRGGDLKKYRENGAAFYVGLDLVPASIAEARKRHGTTHCMFGAVFYEQDFTKPLDLASEYDVVSCQFALHYAWDTAARADQVMANAATRLKGDGAFLITVPDYDEILRRLVTMSTKQDAFNYAKRAPDGTYIYRIGSEDHWLEFTSPLSFTAFFQSLRATPYGHRYVYWQAGAVDRVPEFLVPPRELARLAAAHGLRVDSSTNFLRLLEAPRHLHLLAKMRCSLPLEAREAVVVGLYRVVVLRPAKRKREAEGGSGDRDGLSGGTGPASRPAPDPAA
jgi:mRNA (guanine-N7-)-methyltransferase